MVCYVAWLNYSKIHVCTHTYTHTHTKKKSNKECEKYSVTNHTSWSIPMNSEKAQLSWFKTLLINAAASFGFSNSHWLACSKKTGEGHGAVRHLNYSKKEKRQENKKWISAKLLFFRCVVWTNHEYWKCRWNNWKVLKLFEKHGRITSKISQNILLAK